MQPNWKGVYPAITTKFTADDKLDMDLFVKGLDAQVNAGVDGIIMLRVSSIIGGDGGILSLID